MAGRKGRSGPNRKPTKLRILEGNRSRTPIPAEVEPDGDAIRPTRFRNPMERTSWDKLVPPLAAVGLATSADQEMLERMVYWHAIHIHFAYSNHADFGLSERAFKQFERIASQFGMTPSARAGLHVGNKGRSENATQKYLA